jgi:hypothetical protein
MIPRDPPIPALLEFIATWVTDLSAKHRVATSLIPPFVPPPLRAIYELAGNHPVPYTEQWRAPKWIPGLFGTQDRLLPLDQLVVKDGRFTFVHENQGVWWCETLINQDDPPVFSNASSLDGSDEGMREVCPSLSHFLTTFCLHELSFGSKHLFCVDSEPQDARELVTGNLEPLWLDGTYAYKGAKYSFLLCERDLLIMSTGMGPPGDCWLGYNKEEASKLLGARHEIRQIH